MFYTVIRFILTMVFKIFFRLRIFGRENFPIDGPVIVAPNHASFFDPFIVGVSAPRKVVFLARDNLFRNKVVAKVLSYMQAFPLKRQGPDLNAFRLAISKLSGGHAVLVFPEGTRSEDGALQEPKLGIGFLGSISGADILPCYVKGSMDAWPRHSAFPRVRRISVYFGMPLKFGEEISGDKRGRYKYIAEQVMAAIKKLKEDSSRVENIR